MPACSDEDARVRIRLPSPPEELPTQSKYFSTNPNAVPVHGFPPSMVFLYMLVGAFSSNAYSYPRATKDADIVIDGTKPGQALHDVVTLAMFTARASFVLIDSKFVLCSC